VKKFKNVPTYKKWKIVRGDKVMVPADHIALLGHERLYVCVVPQVQVISGQYKGDQGTVLAVHRKQNMVTVDNTKLVRAVSSQHTYTQAKPHPLPLHGVSRFAKL